MKQTMHKENSGLSILNSHAAGMPYKTVIVLGVPRGGTSMVSGVLTKLGIFMGTQDKLEPFYENTELGNCHKAKDKIKTRKTIAAYNDKYAIWGMKVLPKAWFFWFSRTYFRHPVYIVVFRDILAIAKRQVVSLDKSLITEMFKALWFNGCLLVFLRFNKKPTLIISYEKTILFPESFVNELCSFLGIIDERRAEAAIQFIKPSPADYLMRSTTQAQLDKDALYFGYVDVVNQNNVSGWALSVLYETPIIVALWVNGDYRQAVEANLIRHDVKEKDRRFHETCGFVFSFDDKNKLRRGDCVEVKISEKNIPLVNSPYVLG